MLSYRILFIFLLKRLVLIVLAALVFVLGIIWILNLESNKDAITEPLEPKNDISKPTLYVFTPPTRTQSVLLAPGFGNHAPLTCFPTLGGTHPTDPPHFEYSQASLPVKFARVPKPNG